MSESQCVSECHLARLSNPFITPGHKAKRKQRNLSQEFKALFFFCERRPGIEFRNHLASVPCSAVAIALTGCLPDDIRTNETHWSNAAMKGMCVEGLGHIENIHEVFVVILAVK